MSNEIGKKVKHLNYPPSHFYNDLHNRNICNFYS